MSRMWLPELLSVVETRTPGGGDRTFCQSNGLNVRDTVYSPSETFLSKDSEDTETRSCGYLGIIATREN